MIESTELSRLIYNFEDAVRRDDTSRIASAHRNLVDYIYDLDMKCDAMKQSRDGWRDLHDDVLKEVIGYCEKLQRESNPSD